MQIETLNAATPPKYFPKKYFQRGIGFDKKRDSVFCWSSRVMICGRVTRTMMVIKNSPTRNIVDTSMSRESGRLPGDDVEASASTCSARVSFK